MVVCCPAPFSQRQRKVTPAISWFRAIPPAHNLQFHASCLLRRALLFTFAAAPSCISGFVGSEALSQELNENNWAGNFMKLPCLPKTLFNERLLKIQCTGKTKTKQNKITQTGQMWSGWKSMGSLHRRPGKHRGWGWQSNRISLCWEVPRDLGYWGTCACFRRLWPQCTLPF